MTTPTTHAYLVQVYGPLLRIEEVAQLLRRSPKSLATTLTSRARQDDPYIARLREAVVRIGRRRLFRAQAVAELIDGEVGQ